MKIGIERSIVLVGKTDRISDPPYRCFGASEEMQRIAAIATKKLSVGCAGLGGIVRPVARIDADGDEPVVALRLERYLVKRIGNKMPKRDAAQRRAAQIFQNENDRRFREIIAKSDCPPFFIDEHRVQRQSSSGMWLERQVDISAPGSRMRRRRRQKNGRKSGAQGEGSDQYASRPFHPYSFGNPRIPFCTTLLIASSIGRWTVPFCLSIQ